MSSVLCDLCSDCTCENVACGGCICPQTASEDRRRSILQNNTCLRYSWKNHSAAWQNKHETKVIRNVPGTTHNGPDVSVFTPETERTDSALLNAGSAVAPAQPEDPDLCHRLTDCTQARQIPPDRASGDQLLSCHHQCSGKTHRNSVKDVREKLAKAKETRPSQRRPPKNSWEFQDQIPRR